MAKATSTDPVVIEWAKAQPTAVWAGTPADPLGARRTAVDLEWTVDAYLARAARRVEVISPLGFAEARENLRAKGWID